VPRRIKEVKVKVIEVAMGPVHTLCLTEESVQDQEGFLKKGKKWQKKDRQGRIFIGKASLFAKKPDISTSINTGLANWGSKINETRKRRGREHFENKQREQIQAGGEGK
jgi:hypothetical protein